jgi:hypothetical protein
MLTVCSAVCVVVEDVVVCEGTSARVVGSAGLRLEWRVSGERRKNAIRRAQRLISHTRGRYVEVLNNGGADMG